MYAMYILVINPVETNAQQQLQNILYDHLGKYRVFLKNVHHKRERKMHEKMKMTFS